MKFSVPVTSHVFCPMSLTKPDDFLDAVRTFCRLLPQIRPTNWGWWEPLKQEFDEERLDKLVPKSGNCETIYWQRRKKPKAEGGFSVRWRSGVPTAFDTHSKIYFTVELGQVEQEALIDYLKEASIRSRADFAFVDALTPEYREFARESEAAPYRNRFLIATHLLRHWLPDVFWATVFGPPYVRLFGKERLLTAPAYSVQELGPETVYVQLTERIADTVEDHEGVQSRRKLFKEHLRSDAFYVSGKGYDWNERGPVGDVFDVPTFRLIED
ncbi:MAG: hypothetical protein J0H44_15505 [Alphaproteobacteria bacterium]|jgi:hypothetical protein|nr:hypothetical protein [Alphaproteobacteria bacterium]